MRRYTDNPFAAGADGARRALRGMTAATDWDADVCYMPGARALAWHPLSGGVREWCATKPVRGADPCAGLAWRLVPRRRQAIRCGRGRGRRAL